MTSASQKVNLDRFENDKLTCDIMPACVATSFPHITHDVYKQEYLRNEQDQVSEASSPGSQQFDDFNKRFQYSQPNASTDNIDHVAKLRREHGHRRMSAEDLDSKSIENYRGRYNGWSGRRHEKDQVVESSSPNFHNEELSDPNSEALFPEKNNSRSSSPKYGHPRKQIQSRFLFNHNEVTPDTYFPTKLIKNCNQSPSAFKPHKSSKVVNNRCYVDSSDILRKMYVSFGSADEIKKNHHQFQPLVANGQHCDVNCAIPKVNKQKNGDGSEDNLGDGGSGGSGSDNQSHCRSRSNERDESHHASNQRDNKPNFCCTHKRCNSCNSVSASSNSISQRTYFPLEESSSELTRDDSLDTSKMDDHKKCTRKRKISENDLNNQDYISHRHSHSSNKNRPSESSVNNNKKRARYSSSESTESLPKLPHNTLQNFCKMNNPNLSYVNPLLHSPAALAALGLPSTGYPFSMPSLPQTNLLDSSSNPLLFSANPYLTNHLLFYEMLNQANAASMMSMLPNPALPHFGLTPGISLEQLRAIQQMQAASLYKKPGSFLGPSLFAPSALPTMASSLLPAATKKKHEDTFNKANHIRDTDSRKRHLSDKTSSDENTKDIVSSDLFPSRPVNKLNRSPRSEPTEMTTACHRHVASRTVTNEAKSTFKVQTERPKHDVFPSRKVKENVLSNPQHSSRQPTGSRKRQEKRLQEKTKSKDKHNQKLLSEMAHQTKYPKMQDYEDIETDGDTLDNAVDVGGISNETKSPGYKNLTRERRLVANARERTRVHTISSAFDELRAQIPSYSCNQKLSKLAILRIACEYIRTLSVLAGHDETTTLPQGVDQCTRVLQSESRARSRRKSNKAQIEWEMVNYELHKSKEESLCGPPSHGKGSCDRKEETSPQTNISSSRNGFVAGLSSTPSSSVDVEIDNSTDVFDNDVADDNNDDVIDVEVIEEKSVFVNDVIERKVSTKLDQANDGSLSSHENHQSPGGPLEEEESADICVE